MKIKQYIPYKNITFCCQDCGNQISYKTALYNTGKCMSCCQKGKIASKETRLKMSKARRGQKNHNFGKHHSKKTLLLISKNLKGRKLSKEHIKKISGKNHHNFGKHHSKETCIKIGKAHKGIKLSKEAKLKISKANKGHKHSLKTKLKMSKERMGNKNNNWQGGVSFFPYSIEFTKELKSKIRYRDNHICQNCGITEEEHIKKYNYILSIHHIDYDKQNCKPTNLITTCTSCNTKANTNRDYWFAYYTYIIRHFVSKNG